MMQTSFTADSQGVWGGNNLDLFPSLAAKGEEGNNSCIKVERGGNSVIFYDKLFL